MNHDVELEIEEYRKKKKREYIRYYMQEYRARKSEEIPDYCRIVQRKNYHTRMQDPEYRKKRNQKAREYYQKNRARLAQRRYELQIQRKLAKNIDKGRD